MILKASSRLLFWLLLAPPLAAGQALGQASDPFTVRGVHVDVTADSAEVARAGAIARGQEEAYGRLMQRIVPQGELARVPAADQSLLPQLVQGFGVSDERTTDVRYLADFTVRFSAPAIQQLLQSRGIPYAVTQSKPVVVIPIWDDGADAVLWEGENLWADAWRDGPYSGELVPFIVPLGDVGDVLAIDIQRALAGDADALTTIAGNYQADAALVTQAVLSGGQLSVTATLYRPGSAQPQNDTLQLQEGETIKLLLARAAARQSAGPQEGWKQANLLRFDQQAQLTAKVPLRSLQDWIAVQQRLAALAQIRATKVNYVSRSEAEVMLTYLGNEVQLAQALATRDLQLEQIGFGDYVITLTPGTAPAVPEAAGQDGGLLSSGETEGVPAEGAPAGEPGAPATVQ